MSALALYSQLKNCCSSPPNYIKLLKKGDLPGIPVVKACTSTAAGMGSTPGQGTMILHDAWHSQKTQKQTAPFFLHVSNPFYFHL